MQSKAATAFAALILACVLSCFPGAAGGPAAAQDKAKANAKEKAAQPFNVAKMSQGDAQKRLETSIRLSQASRNCKVEALSDQDDARLTGFINALTRKLKLDPNRLERVYYVRSFDEYEKDEEKFCKTYGPQIPDFVKRLP